MIAYIDTSAAMKLVIEEAESAALLEQLAGAGELQVVASWLLHAEMHCAVGRHPEAVDSEAVATVLGAVDLIDLTRGDLLAAGTLAPLRSGDAIHLAVALRCGVDEMITYDDELTKRARAAGLTVLAPR